jgi:hypothetical protein
MILHVNDFKPFSLYHKPTEALCGLRLTPNMVS